MEASVVLTHILLCDSCGYVPLDGSVHTHAASRRADPRAVQRARFAVFQLPRVGKRLCYEAGIQLSSRRL